MSSGQDPDIAEKKAAIEDGGSASDFSLVNGVARDYEIKCALSKSLGCAILRYSCFIPLFSQQVHARRVRISSATGNAIV